METNETAPSHQEDKVSVHSNESNASGTGQQESLESLESTEDKHSKIYYNLILTNKVLKLDLENVQRSCQRFENDIKKRNEVLENYYKKFAEYQKRNGIQLREKLSSLIRRLDEVNSKFSGAFTEYSSEALKKSINSRHNEKKFKEKGLTVCKMNLKAQEKNVIELNPISNIDQEIKRLSELSMKRPEIHLQERCTRLTNEIQKLEQKLQQLRAAFKQQNK